MVAAIIIDKETNKQTNKKNKDQHLKVLTKGLFIFPQAIFTL